MWPLGHWRRCIKEKVMRYITKTRALKARNESFTILNDCLFSTEHQWTTVEVLKID